MERKAKIRSLMIGLFFSLFVVYILGRLYMVQVVQAEMLQSRAEDLWTENQTIPAKRGMITDRTGKPLAEDSTAYTVSVNPERIHAWGIEKEVADGLAGVLASSPGAVMELSNKIYGMATKKRPDSDKYMLDVEIKNEGWKIDGETKLKVEAFVESLKAKTGHKNVGISIRETSRRFYPNNSLASHVLGYSDKDGNAKSGIELQYDDILKGTSGRLISEHDRAGIELPDSKKTYIPAVNGKSIKLTIDQNIQFYVENAVQKSFAEWKPKAISVIVSDPKTMEILAMTSYPDYNPNKYWETKNQKDFINRAVSWPYEPGSTFKLVTLAGTIEEGVFNPNDKYQSGSFAIPNGPVVHDHNNGQGWGKITFMEGLLRSSNVGFAKLGLLLGNDKLLTYIEKFGFGEKTGIELPDEKAGVVALKYPSDFARATYGQGNVTATAMQLTAAYGAIANGGKLMTPHIVKEIIDLDTNEVVQTTSPEVVRQVVSEETAKQTVLDLEQVVANQDVGTGKKAYINGYRVAGKTGTANIVPDGGGKGYSGDTWLISFVGFAPVEDPRILVTILIDQPDLGGDYHKGSDAWATIFRDVMTQSLSYLGVPSGTTQLVKNGAKIASLTEPIASVPDVAGFTVNQAKNVLTQVGLKAEVLGKGGKVQKQFPAPGTEISLSQRIYIMTEADGGGAVPDMTRKSLREAMEMCSILSLVCKTNGEGYVTGQSIDGDNAVILELKPLRDTGGTAQTPPPQVPSAKAQDNPKKVGSNGSSAKKSPEPSSSGASGKTKLPPSPSPSADAKKKTQ